MSQHSAGWTAPASDVLRVTSAGLSGVDPEATPGYQGKKADGAESLASGLAALGDLSLLHDVGSLLLPGDEPAPRIQVVVGNDGGGTIFDGLEVAGTADTEDLDRAFYTPHSVALEPLAAAYGWAYAKAATPDDLARALSAEVVGPQLIEVPLAR